MTIKMVSGFVPIPGHPRSVEEYSKLGARLIQEVERPIALIEATVEECWLYRFLQWKPSLQGTCATADNPKKNSIAYHMVQHEKTEWLVAAAKNDPRADVFCWIDFGIFSVPGVTAAVIQEALRRAENERAIVIPGCWDKSPDVPELEVCWRFCGGFFVVPREYLMHFDAAVKKEAMDYITRTGVISWEVNTWARMELENEQLPIWHYKADHNQTMFTNYPEPHRAS
jgi:hypothetical protein